MVDISDIKNKVNNIDTKFKKVLDYLKDAEGNALERNSTEKDITAPLGVYRYEHPEAEVFKYIDQVASSITTRPSKEWSKDEIKSIDKLLDKDVTYYLAYLFYFDFYKTANLSYYDEEVIIGIISIYANGPAICNKSVQASVNEFAIKGYITLDTGKPLVVDGAIGNGTKAELTEIDNLSKDINYAFRLLFLHKVKTAYLDLALANPEKYQVYLKGWFNRVDRLLAM